MICRGEELADGGRGVRFQVESEGGPLAAFVLRHRGRIHAYLNRCAHVGVELDWMPGEFLDDSRLYLICSTHGATYLPESGECVGGPCRGGRLTSLPVFERDGGVYLNEWLKDG